MDIVAMDIVRWRVGGAGHPLVARNTAGAADGSGPRWAKSVDASPCCVSRRGVISRDDPSRGMHEGGGGSGV